MNKSVLVVEDEVGVRRALGRLLGEWGFRMTEASNGREAIQRLTEETPAAIVIDLLMPVMSGAELLKALRRNAFYRRIPTVVMTGAIEAEVTSALGAPVVFKPNLERIPEILKGLIAASSGPMGDAAVSVAAAVDSIRPTLAADSDAAG